MENLQLKLNIFPYNQFTVITPNNPFMVDGDMLVMPIKVND